MASSQLRLDTRRPLKDGTYPVQITVGHGSNIYLSTGVFLPLSDWEPRTQRATGPRARRTNALLDTLLSRVINRILDLMESGQWSKLSRRQKKEMLLNTDLTSPTVDAPSLADVFELCIGRRSGHTADIFRQAYKKLSAYCAPASVRFDDLTKSWIDGFYRSLSSLSINSRHLHMRCLRTVCLYAYEENITRNYPFRHYTIPKEETPMRVVPVEKMRIIASLPLSGEDAAYRDWFLLMFYLIGINSVDLCRLTRKNVVDGRIEYRRAKTGKLYSIKIEPEAQKILDRYPGGAHLLSFPDRYKNYCDLSICVNRRLKVIGAAVGSPSLSTYYARYSWATYAASLDIPKETISEALGHSYGSAVTGIYIQFKRDKIDAANRRVIDYALYEK